MRFILTIFLFIATSCAVLENKPNYDKYHSQYVSTLFHQRAAEYKALCRQTYDQAQEQLYKTKRMYKGSKPLAVVMDVDETILDNSPYQGKQAIAGKGYDLQSWNEWIRLRSAIDIPGSTEYIRYANKLGVKVILITNRLNEVCEDTRVNLVNNGHRFTKLICKNPGQTKTERRNLFTDKYNVVQYIGDNLGDFSTELEEASGKNRNILAIKNRKNFGKKYFLLPNSMYGEWYYKIKNRDPKLNLKVP